MSRSPPHGGAPPGPATMPTLEDPSLRGAGEASAARPSAALPGLPDRYEDLGLLGLGGIGEVRLVFDRRLGARFAMKLLRASLQGSPSARRRLLAEARLTARLHHPGIVAVQDLGELDDGRPWFTMEEVRGQTLAAVVAEHLRAGLPLRRRVELFARVCEAMASAHELGVIHRDLKPDNAMVGAFGEVRVMDWGLARGLGDEDPDAAAPEDGATQVGQVLGTPGFMSPEQARGEAASATARSDVYALGAMLYAVLSGVRPYQEWSGLAAVHAALAGPPTPVADRSPVHLPPELCQLVARAMAARPEDRPADAGELAAAVRDWLEGARKEAEARAQVAEALRLLPEVEALRAAAARSQREAQQRLDGVAPHAPLEQKLPAWRLEDAAVAARLEARKLEEELQRGLRAALAQAPDLREAHEAISDLYRARLVQAEAAGDALGAAEAEGMLRHHDRGRHAAWLRGDGRVSLVSDPPAPVSLYRYALRDRREVPVPVGEAHTPLVEHALPRGRYLLVLRAPGRPAVHYPVEVGRLEHWDGLDPDGAPQVLRLPTQDELGAEERLVPAGWFRSGGDPDALDALPEARRWVDDLIARRDPVTNREYLFYIQNLWDQGRREQAAAALPVSEAKAAQLLVLEGDRWRLGADPDGRPLRARQPVVFLTPEQTWAYVAWRAARDGLPWRLPHDQEWEKAARGVDGRVFPWGWRFDPIWTRMQHSTQAIPELADVDALDADTGPYGLRGMAGNSRDLCHNAYRHLGPPEGEARVVAEPAAPDAPYLVVRGGSWSSAAVQCRLASRLVAQHGKGSSTRGLRLVRARSTGG